MSFCLCFFFFLVLSLFCLSSWLLLILPYSFTFFFLCSVILSLCPSCLPLLPFLFPASIFSSFLSLLSPACFSFYILSVFTSFPFYFLIPFVLSSVLLPMSVFLFLLLFIFLFPSYGLLVCLFTSQKSLFCWLCVCSINITEITLVY